MYIIIKDETELFVSIYRIYCSFSFYFRVLFLKGGGAKRERGININTILHTVLLNLL